MSMQKYYIVILILQFDTSESSAFAAAGIKEKYKYENCASTSSGSMCKNMKINSGYVF